MDRSADTKRHAALRRMIFLLVGLVLLSPIVVYIYVFGWHISNEHSRWGEMGSALAGIYTPILSILTLLVLLVQVALQERMNTHTFDQSFAQDARNDVQYYLSELAAEFARELDDGSEISRVLISMFAYTTVEELSSPKFYEFAGDLNRRHHRLLSIWMAYYSVLSGLRANNYHPYSTAFAVAKQRAIMMLSYDGCAALDQYMWCVSQGRLSFGFEFATQLAEALGSNPSIERTSSSCA